MWWDNLAFGVLPYVGMLLFFFVPVYRAYKGQVQWSARGDFQWTTRASGFFGRPMMGGGSLALHWGIFILFAGHVVGLVGGYLGRLDMIEVFHWVGLASGLLFGYGILVALLRRIVNPEMRAMSTAEDYAILTFLFVIPALALYQVIFPQVFGLSAVVGPWLVSIYTLSPDVGLMAGATLLTKIHIIIATIFFAYFPFTKLVHLWSYPFGYITRPYIAVRSYLRTMK